MNEPTTIAANADTATGQWLRRVQIKDGPAGDLIADMRRDPNVPGLFRNIRHMRAYLMSKGACTEAIAAVPKVWLSYRGWVDRNPAGRSNGR